MIVIINYLKTNKRPGFLSYIESKYDDENMIIREIYAIKPEFRNFFEAFITSYTLR